MTIAVDCNFTIVASQEDKETSPNELKSMLEKGSDSDKMEAMKQILTHMLNGDPLPSLLMHVIRFIMPSKNNLLKKLLLIYWEICPKLDSNGKPKQEMILVCNALRNDLQHPNEYIRGATLRFISKLKQVELLEPCVPSVRACLDHRHAYVRKNAVLAVFFIHKNAEFLLPDATELIRNYIANESDPNAKRNALSVLINTNPVLAYEYLSSVWSQVSSFDPSIQLSILELIRKDCKRPNADKARYIQTILELLQSPSNSVKYEAANTLVILTNNINAMKATGACYIDLVVKEADTNIKLIVLERFKHLQERHERAFEDQVMDVLRILSTPDIEIRKKCLNIAIEMVSVGNVEEVVGYLKKELFKTQSGEYENNEEYRHLLISSVHQYAIRFSEVAESVVGVLIKFLGDSNTTDVVSFIREVIEKFPSLRNQVLEQLVSEFPEIKSGRVFRSALWITGEYSLELASIEYAFIKIRQVIGELPILDSEMASTINAPNDKSDKPGNEKTEVKPTTPSNKRVLADGTYATETAYSSYQSKETKIIYKAPLRALLLSGDFYAGTVLATTLTKLVVRFSSLSKDISTINGLKAEAMLIMTSILRVGTSSIATTKIDEDSYDRILCCLRIVSNLSEFSEPEIQQVFLQDTRRAFLNVLEAEHATKKSRNPIKKVQVQVDDSIGFRLFKNSKHGTDLVVDYENDLIAATGTHDKHDRIKSKLEQIVQLTGFSDPVYAEAYVSVNQYDIVLDVIIVNQTSHTLQNLTLEFSTLGDLKLVERPLPQTIGPRGFHTLKANLKVSSTETGLIFGNIVFDAPVAVESSYVILNEIRIDIMEFIQPGSINENAFRTMWTEFEWENKVNVNTNIWYIPFYKIISDLRLYLEHLVKTTNMAILTPLHALSGECGFLSANLYAKSIFGEDALANISLEQIKAGDHVTGNVRIRAKTQGIALGLGDKILSTQMVKRGD